jgi:hypothetical protein
MLTAILRRSLLVAALLGSACSPSTQSPVPPTPSPVAPTSSPTPSPTPPPPPELVGGWNLTVRLTDVTPGPSGGGCVAETMRSQIGVPTGYTLSVDNNRKVTIATASGDYACSFTPLIDSLGFTTDRQAGYYTCTNEPRTFRCDNGESHRLISIGQGISGRVSGTEMSGAWDIAWCDATYGDGPCIEVGMQFTGIR